VLAAKLSDDIDADSRRTQQRMDADAIELSQGDELLGSRLPITTLDRYERSACDSKILRCVLLRESSR
jgi:hypothetical protein